MADNDFFDTRFEDAQIIIDDGLVNVGDDVNLLAKEPALRKLMIGAGWEVNNYAGSTLDLDLSIFLLNKHNLTRENEDFVFYNQKETAQGGVKHLGDSRSGAGDGDDEVIEVDLHALHFDIMKIQICISIYKGYEKEQHLEQVRNAYIRLCNAETKHEICRLIVDDVFKDHQETAVLIGSIDREGPKWHFRPAAEFVDGGLGAVARRFALIINQE